MKESASRKLSKIIEKWRMRKRGQFVVYTKEGKRYSVPLYYLNHPIFRVLLEMAEEEYGWTIDGPLRVPCEKEFLDYILSLLPKHPPLDVEKALLLSITCRGGAASQNQQGAPHHQTTLLSCGG